MSKLWSVHPMYLDNARLTREHQSTHRVLNGIANGTIGAKSRFGGLAGYVVWRHYLCAFEMRIRGMNHESFVVDLWKRIPKDKRGKRFEIAEAEILKDLATLRARRAEATRAMEEYGRVALPLKGCPDELNVLNRELVKSGFPQHVFNV